MFARPSLMQVVTCLLLSFSLAASHFITAAHMFQPRQWLESDVEMPFRGRALTADVARFVADGLHIDYDSLILAFLFPLQEIGACFIALLVIADLGLRLSNGRKDVALLACGLFLWQVAYMLIISPVLRLWFCYDMVSPAIMAVGLWLIVTRQTIWLVPLMVVGTWNRETAIFLAAWYFLYHFNLKNLIKTSCVASTLVFVSLVTKILVLYFHDLHGDFISLYDDSNNLRIFNNLLIWQHFRSLAVLGTFGFLWLFLREALRSLHREPLRLCLWSFVPYFLIMLVVGNTYEIRIFVEFTPLMAVILAVAWGRHFIPVHQQYVPEPCAPNSPTAA